MGKATFVVEVEWERVQGKFAARDEIVERITEELEGVESSISLDGLGADGDTEYEITSFEVEEREPARKR